MRGWIGVLVCLGVMGLGCDDGTGEALGADGGDSMHEHQAGLNLYDQDDGPVPPAEFLPAASGTCPGFVDGEGCEDDGSSLICTFEPEGVPPRPVRIWFKDAARDKPSPMVFYYHGMGGQALNTIQPLGGLGPDLVDTMTEEGAIVVALEMETGRVVTPTSQPWKTAVQDGLLEPAEGRYDDLLVQDEVIACAQEKLGVNTRRIHVTGMSAGGLMTGNLIMRRSGYLASVAPFSGGIMGLPKEQDESHKVPVMMSFGGTSDKAVGQDFAMFATEMDSRLKDNGNFHYICDHGGGHTLSASLAPVAWQFFKDHPYGVDSPYADGLPEGVPDTCALP